MENTLDLRDVVKHLVNGTLGENLCIICLMPLNDLYESIFTKVCKEDKEYCIADVLAALCNIQFSDTDYYNVCVNCFMTASVAYKFYLQTKRSNEILNFYTDGIERSLDNVELPDEPTTNTLCMSLPYITLETSSYDYDLQGIGLNNLIPDMPIKIEKDIQVPEKMVKKENADDEQIVVVVQENGQKIFYKVVENGDLEMLSKSKKKTYKNTLKSVNVDSNEKPVKRRKKRLPMTTKCCSRCPVKYRFLAKLKKHMKLQHNVDLYVCKVCQFITENELEYHRHLKTHTNIHQCAVCNMVFKKRDTIINHLKWHEKMNNIGQVESAHVCEVCGVVLEHAAALQEHYEGKHHKKFACYFCGRMYKGEASFEMHIKKHEAYMRREQRNTGDSQPEASAKKNKKKCMCSTCGRYFVDERALMWHQRLHNNERPYICDVCGRGFVSVNRRNQHALCAHSAPARRCPLCPALFHLRSMVNTHIKKVHLTTHKRRNRVSKHQNAYWRTEPVPLHDLSVEIQNDILELQAAKKEERDWTFVMPESLVATEDLVFI